MNNRLLYALLAPERVDNTDAEVIRHTKVLAAINHTTKHGVQKAHVLLARSLYGDDILFKKWEISFDQVYKDEVGLKVVKNSSHIAVAILPSFMCTEHSEKPWD